jgi:hypothetical protein
VQQRENSIIQLLSGLQMATRNTMGPRASIVETNRTLGTKSRNPLTDGFGAHLEIPGH